MNKMPSHTHISIFILILGMLYLEGCSLYHNYIWYEPRLLNENDEVVIPEKKTITKFGAITLKQPPMHGSFSFSLLSL